MDFVIADRTASRRLWVNRSLKRTIRRVRIDTNVDVPNRRVLESRINSAYFA